MKDQYVGDIGDFGKVLLLKHLASLGFKLGVHWVRTKNDSSLDGKFIGFIDDRGIHSLRCCDPDVFDKIVPLAKKPTGERTIHDLEALIRSFTLNCVFYSQHIDGDLPRPRCDQIAFETLVPSKADIVFFDPDNGIGGEGKRSPKHVYLDELRRYWDRGQSLLIYHHLPRVPAQIEIHRKKELLEDLPGSRVRYYHFRRGTGRVYWLCLQSQHFERVLDHRQLEQFAPLLVSKREWALGRCF